MRTPILDTIMCVITKLGNAGMIWILLTVILLIIPKTRRTGVILMLDWRITLVCLVAFVGVVLVTRYVSAGSLTVVTLFFLLWVILGQTGNLGLLPEYLTESYLVVFLWAALAFWRHRANLVRLIHGTENKFGSKKKE